jgi:hypothetical protein
MDIQSFIQSGLLEAYVFGQCSAEELALVEQMLAQHAEVRAELAVIEMALEGYAAANSEAPPAWMKGRILETIDNEAVSPRPPAPSPLSLPAMSPTVLRVFQVLALGLALICGFFFFQKNNLTSEKTALENRVAELQKQIADCARRDSLMEKIAQVNVLLRDRATRAVPLSNGPDGKFTSFAYHNTAHCEVAIDLATLPAPAPGKYFQFWSIVDGQPVSMGMVDLRAAGGWQVIPCQTGALALAISQEDNPNGNLKPTAVVMVGVIPAG